MRVLPVDDDEEPADLGRDLDGMAQQLESLMASHRGSGWQSRGAPSSRTAAA
jgi:hypothetical protein